MQQTNLHQLGAIGGADTISAHTFKEIEQFSKEVCQNLATKYGDRYTKVEVIYGLTAFLAAVHHAVKQPSKKEKRHLTQRVSM